LIVQVPDMAMMPPLAHDPVPALEKFAALVPVIVKYGVPSICADVPLLVTVTVSGELVVFMR
jgi:hypothetical protein